MSILEFLSMFAIIVVFVAIRFALPAALMAFFCFCDRHFLHPQFKP